MRVGLIGINHKLADLKLREKLAKACQKRVGTLQCVQGDHHFVLLSTCNRTEIYFSSSDLAETHSYLLNILRHDVEEEFDHKLYSYFGIDCFAHLARVAAGLDSAILAETEIQGQVKMAYESVLEYHLLPKELHFLFQKSLGIAKKIRSELNLGRGLPTIDHAIFNTGKHFFKILENPRILFIGASEINHKILSFFLNKNLKDITLCNRSQKSAKTIINDAKVKFLEWEHLESWHTFDWIIFGTKCPDYLVHQQNIPQNMLGQKLVMDLSVPRNVEPMLGKHPQITLLNIDQLNRLLKIRSQTVNRSLNIAEEMITSSCHNLIERYTLQQTNRSLPLVGIA